MSMSFTNTAPNGSAIQPIFPWGAEAIAALTQQPFQLISIESEFSDKQGPTGAMAKPSIPQERADHHAMLMQKIASAQDKDAFREVFSYYAPRVKSYLLRFNLNAEQAEDLAQEVMVTLWRKAGQYDAAKAALSTWIFRIARNRFIDQSRKQRYPEVNADDHLSTLVAPEETDRPLMQQQTSIHVQAALSKLSTEQRTVIELSFFEELSHSQIADRLSMPLGTVKSRIRLAFKALRVELESTT